MAVWRVAAVFFLHAFTSAMLHTRVPDLQLSSGFNDAVLGLVLMGAPIGSMLAFPLASHVIEEYGTRWVTLVSLTLMMATIPVMALVDEAIPLGILMAINGAGSTLGAMAFNVEADRLEASIGRRIMNGCHGAWSVGYLLASSIGGGLRGLGVSLAAHLWTIIPVAIAITIWVQLSARPAPPRPFVATERKSGLRFPSLLILALVAVGLGAELLEGAARVWATILMRDNFDVVPWVESAALPAMVLTMAAGRLLADRWIDRFGPVPVARVLLATAIVGLAIVAFAGHPYLVIVGFALAGAGICVIYPLSISAAARLGDGPSSQNVATLTLIIQIVMLVAPLLTGLLAEQFGARMAFAALLPLLAVGWLSCSALAGHPASRPVAEA